ncbi:hypothetical protein AZI86_00630 [Bdellovibrio bacteriovorus]|uniref:Uncharacterized protein n=1 Tax=Bdellovibrio bacteriovorus TaxID=959 RepID=A0A150WMJ9_BDEBC|nr:hypothetical protein [Bdellovibrio bacteriovorus]KYG65618.1 hypothetical protein AZI86_00630 [Bdellovibrio bacteriovorus]
MKKWTLIIMAIIFVLGAIPFAEAQNKAPKSAAAEPAEPPVAKNWKESKAALNALAVKFRDAKLTKEQKVELLPASNNLLYDTQQLKLSKAEKAEQIKVIVDFLAATIDTDFANSNTDSVYDDFKVNKKAYLAEINKITDKKIKEEIIEAFDSWADLEKEAKKGPTPDDESASVPEAQH